MTSYRGLRWLWAILAVVVLIVSFGAGWWWSVGAAIAWAIGNRSRAWLIVAAAFGLGSAVLWLYLIPQTAGSEAVLVILAVLSASAGLASADLARRPPISPPATT